MTPNINRLLDEFKKWHLSTMADKTASHIGARICDVAQAPGRQQGVTIDDRFDGAQMKQAPIETKVVESDGGGSVKISALFDKLKLLVPIDVAEPPQRQWTPSREIPELQSGEMVNLIISCYDIMSKDVVEGVFSLEVIDPIEGLSAVLENDAIKISGVPDVEYGKHMKIRLSSNYKGQVVSQAKTICFVFPKHKSIEPDRSEPFPSENLDGFYVPFKDGTRLIGASIRGRSHADEGSFRDDSLGFWADEENHLLCAVVSDGAGSATYSRRGAWRVIDAFTHSFASKDIVSELIACAKTGDEQKVKVIFAKAMLNASIVAMHGIAEDAQDVQACVSDFSATILLFAVLRLPEESWIMSFSVGDGLIAIVKDDFTSEVICTPDHGESKNQTIFLSERISKIDLIEKRVFIRREKNFKSVCAMTDGVSNPVFPEEKDAPLESWKSFCESIFQSLDSNNPVSKLQEELAFESPGYNDDRTVVALMGVPL